MSRYLSDAQLASEIARCEYCEDKPCRTGCPASCSPADFLMAARLATQADMRRSAESIQEMNPFGGTCGLVCPDKFCQARCSHKLFDRPIEIPAAQATIVRNARRSGALPAPAPAKPNGRRVAVVGAGPAGVSAAAYLARKGFSVVVFEREKTPGGACNLIPEHRLDRELLRGDLDESLAGVELRTGSDVSDPSSLLSQGFEAAVVAVGLWNPIRLDIPGADKAISGLDFLRDASRYKFAGAVAVVGGGATAVDCATTAARHGAAHVEMIALEKLSEMPLTQVEMRELAEAGVAVTGRTRLTRILGEGGVGTRKVTLPAGVAFDPRKVEDVPDTDQARPDLKHVIFAIGARCATARKDDPRLFYAGDCTHGPGTVVEAAASGKTAAAAVEAFLAGQPIPKAEPRRSDVVVPGRRKLPVPLDTDFFGIRLISPFLLSAAPPSDGCEPMRLGLREGWAGGVMKTAFDNVPIHIPSDYMHQFDAETWGNCDNVSGHALDRVCREIGMLRKEFPDRLIAASTGGPVTGRDDSDRAGWQANTKKLEGGGAMAIEYSLSCPQGGDGTEGAIVSQNARLTAKIIGWVLEAGDPSVPKLFKLTAAVTSIEVILRAIREVFDRHPDAKAGVTLANTFPTLAFRPRRAAGDGRTGRWDEGIVMGMSGGGVAPISNLTLASAGTTGIAISGNGGAMDYRSAAHFLALGCGTVQFCTAPMKYGYGFVDELHEGLSHLMHARGIGSVRELVGIANPGAIAGFMELTPVKRISSLAAPELCMGCGNCSRCAYGAIAMGPDHRPIVNPEHCIGCSICTQKCFAGALAMRARTPEELAALREA